MRTLLRSLLVVLLAPAAVAPAQDSPITTHHKYMFKGLKGMLVRAAEVTPEESYGFKPADSVRTFGQIVGHVTDSSYSFCSQALGEKNPAPGVGKSKTSKADLVAALKEALAYCDKAYEGMTDASAAQTVKFHGSDTPKLGVMNVAMVHSVEHYGNLVTYMRMKNLVPPTSDPEFMKQLMR